MIDTIAGVIQFLEDSQTMDALPSTLIAPMILYVTSQEVESPNVPDIARRYKTLANNA